MEQPESATEPTSYSEVQAKQELSKPPEQLQTPISSTNPVWGDSAGQGSVENRQDPQVVPQRYPRVHKLHREDQEDRSTFPTLETDHASAELTQNMIRRREQ